ncbi:ubiquinol-cytochrome c reductase iron-sulfur subunit [Candidatus Nitrospira neomarina]|uniref:Ubiquinol-cytochrome c reductase iron-sulfur subunit n=1 Tax=Candidatus Nitrospira neomarina TaxID=3020899 RepID=A0AA96JVY2_9BACT|nr:ubiquinol-cytochrome c reductase iron-sulfur subunit [Candidatus Nitrospira neomarina]WNM61530.1 ubiquinol-cytochrome c reductase iron-sulfur subunit [Candidatus Nitrospira neomarina]
MQPKLTAKAVCANKEVGKISKVIVDPLSHEISHIIVQELNGHGAQRQIPIDQIQEVVSEEEIILRCSPEEFAQFPILERDQYVTIKEVEIAHLEDHLHVEPGEILVPLPRLEQGVPRRTFFTNMTHAIGTLIALPLVFPVLKYLMKPMFKPYDNAWFSVGNVKKVNKENIGFQFKFTRGFKEAFMPEQQIEKNIWVVKATPAVQQAVYEGNDRKFYDDKGDVIWVNKSNSPYIGYSGKCPHLGCGYKWRKTKNFPDGVFLCPCHLSIYDEAGKVIEGPAPRPLDVLPLKVDAGGEVKIIDVEYKAGVNNQIRLL